MFMCNIPAIPACKFSACFYHNYCINRLMEFLMEIKLLKLIRGGKGFLFYLSHSKISSLLWMLSSFTSNSSINLNQTYLLGDLSMYLAQKIFWCSPNRLRKKCSQLNDEGKQEMKTVSVGCRQCVILDMHCTFKSSLFLSNQLKYLPEVTLQRGNAENILDPASP